MYQVSLGQTSPSMDEGIVSEWLKQEGESVQAGDCLARVESSQAVFEVHASVSGILRKICVGAGMAVRPPDILCYVGEKDEAVPETAAFKQKSELRTQNSGGRNQESAAVQGSEAQSLSTSPDIGIPEGVVPVLMPQAGQTMEEGTLLSWKVKEGDRIEVGQVILEIETDKATMEVEAVDAGRVARIVAKEGDIIEVKMPVAYLAENDADVDEYIRIQNSEFRTQKIEDKKQVRSGEGPASVVSPSVVQEGGRVKASPAARKLAQQRNVDLASVKEGSGPGGRILSTDVASAEVASTSSGLTGTGLSKMRMAIARNLLYSKQNIPHFYAKVTVDAQRLFETYQKTKTRFTCTINDFVTAACARAVCEFAPCRSQYQDDNIHVLPDVNIGIAVGTDDGLSVPVVLRADTLSLQDLAVKTRKVVESARSGKHENVGQGVFTITNLGMFGVEDFQAIINPPESAILAVGAVREGVTVQDGDIKPTRLMAMTLSVDHRVIDGVVAAQFLARVKELLENPEQLI